MRSLVVALMLPTLLALGGCWQETPRNVVQPPVAPPMAPAVAPAPIEAPPIAEAPPEQPPAAEVAPPTPAIEPAPVEQQFEQPIEPRSVGHERVVIFLAGNPLIVDLELTIDGQPHAAALEKLSADVLKLADADGDAQTSWTEIAEHPRLKAGQFGNLPIDGENGRKQLVERYDTDRDGLADADELPRFLTRNAGGARPFSIRGTINDDPSVRRDDPLWRLLDVDEDSHLSGDEIATAAARLRRRDADDDEVLTLAETTMESAAMPGEMPRSRRRQGRDGARLLGASAAWDAVRDGLEQAYALGGRLTADDFQLTPSLFAFLDADHDGEVRRKEWQRLNEALPHIVLTVEVGATADGGSPIRVRSIADELAEAVSVEYPSSNRLLRIGSQSLLVALNDPLGQVDYVQRAEQTLATYDGDKNGYLEASEIPEGVQATIGKLEAIDTDGDGKAYVGELAAYASQQQRAQLSQIHARVATRVDALFELLDQNDDGRIAALEMEQTPARLRGLDRNSDGQLDLEELPGGLLLIFARGGLDNQDALFALPTKQTIVAVTDSSAPRWFQQMDANRDGAISPREFLGPLEMFAKLDVDGDGFLTAGEAK